LFDVGMALRDKPYQVVPNAKSIFDHIADAMMVLPEDTWVFTTETYTPKRVKG
jgi:hypothetical protein